MGRLNAHTATVSGRKGKDLRWQGQRCRQAGVPEESVRNGYPDNAPVQFGTGYSTSQGIYQFCMDLGTNSDYIPTKLWPFLQPRYSVYCAVRTVYLKIISSQFTAESVVRTPCEFCGAESSTGTHFFVRVTHYQFSPVSIIPPKHDIYLHLHKKRRTKPGKLSKATQFRKPDSTV